MRARKAALHAAPILTTDLKEGIGDLTERANSDRAHEFFKHVLVVDRRVAQPLQGGSRSLCVFLFKAIEPRNLTLFFFGR